MEKLELVDTLEGESCEAGRSAGESCTPQATSIECGAWRGALEEVSWPAVVQTNPYPLLSTLDTQSFSVSCVS